MTFHYSTAASLRSARAAAGLTQHEVARRAGTAQSAVARYESGRAVPAIDTLRRLLAACGHRLQLSAVPFDEQYGRQLEESLRLTPLQRVERNRRITKLAADAARARREGRVRPLVER